MIFVDKLGKFFGNYLVNYSFSLSFIYQCDAVAAPRGSGPRPSAHVAGWNVPCQWAITIR